MKHNSITIALILGLLLNTCVYGAKGDDSIRTLEGHDNLVNSVAVTPDGSKIISGSNDKRIKIWNLSDGQLIRTLEDHGSSVLSVAVTPDGANIISGGSNDRTIKIWNLSDGELIRTLQGHDDWVRSVVVTPDGTKIISGSDDKKIKIWNLSDGQLIRTLEDHGSSVRSVAVTPDGSKIISGSQDYTIKVWNLSDGQLIRTLGQNGSVLSVVFTPDGAKIISGSTANSIKIWNLSDGVLIRTLQGHDSWVRSVVVTPDGSQIVSGSDDNYIKVWNLSDGRLIRTLEGHGDYVNSVTVTSPGGAYIISGSSDRKIKVWDISDLIPPTITPANWYDKKKSQGFGFKVALLNSIAAISVPFCITPSNPNTCDGGNILTYKKDDSTGEWMKHKKIKNPFRNRDNRFGNNMLLNSDYLIVSVPGSNYINTDIGIIVFYKWNEAQDAFVKESIIRYRKTTKNFELGTSISNIDKITAIGMPTCDASADITNSGCTHVYRKKDDGKWGSRYTITVASPKSDDRFGQSASLGSDTTLAVSNNPDTASDQAVFIYGFEGEEWSLLQTLPNDGKLGFGWRVAFHSGILYVSIVNDETDASNAGSIATYVVDGEGQYVASSTIKPETSVEGKHFGFSFSFSSDGSRLVVGARPCEDNQACNVKGSVHVFTNNAGDWAEFYLVESTVADGSDGYGHDVAVEGDVTLASAPFDSTDSLTGKAFFIKK